MVVIEVFDRQAIRDPLVLREIQQVDERAAFRGSPLQRKIVDLSPIDFAAIGEEQQERVCAGDEDMFDRIFFIVFRPGDSFSAAVLGLIDVELRALDVAALRQRDDHRLFGNQFIAVDVG